MHESLHDQVEAALRHARRRAQEGSKPHHVACDQLLCLLHSAVTMHSNDVFTALAEDSRRIGFPGDGGPARGFVVHHGADANLILALQSVSDILDAQELECGVLDGVRAMTQWLFAAVAVGDHARLEQLASVTIGRAAATLRIVSLAASQTANTNRLYH